MHYLGLTAVLFSINLTKGSKADLKAGLDMVDFGSESADKLIPVLQHEVNHLLVRFNRLDFLETINLE